MGQEYGVTTGRRRKVNWLNLDKLIEAVEVGGATDLIVNKCDILQKVGVYRLFHNSTLLEFESLEQMKEYVQICLFKASTTLKRVLFSANPETIEGFNP